VAVGGLHIIGTERHDSRRIDNQLRGRAGRQGDPGSSRFYLSLDDDLMKRFASDRVAGLMERMGLEEDVAIESRIVSKTIESAQSRVEGFNFDIRKRVVEFDDVINKQRETIYAERDKVLRGEDLDETVQQFLDDEIAALMVQFCSHEVPDEWNLEGLAAALRSMGVEGPGSSEDDLWEAGGREALTEHLRGLVDGALHAKETEVGADDWRMVERIVLLRTIDALWVEHLTELDDMRRGIGLRGYAQQDPLNEFRKEAFSLYGELRDLIRHQVASTIFRVSVTRQAPSAPVPLGPPIGSPAAAAMARALSANGTSATGASGAASGAASAAGFGSSVTGSGNLTGSARAAVTAGSGTASGSSGGPTITRGLPVGPAVRGVRESLGDQPISSNGSSQQARPGYTPTGDRIGRNDACWCGSGQKYKKCHGR